MIKLNYSERDIIMTANLEEVDNINFQDFEKKRFFFKDYLFEMIFIIQPLLNFKYSNTIFVSDESQPNNSALDTKNQNIQ